MSPEIEAEPKTGKSMENGMSPKSDASTNSDASPTGESGFFDRHALSLFSFFPLVHIGSSLVVSIALICFGGAKTRASFLGYYVWALFLDRSPQRGGYDFFWKHGMTQWLRSMFVWKWASQYFPVRLHQTTSISKEDGPLIFVCHPHGIIGVSPMTHFGTNATGFIDYFPGVEVHLLGHSAIFRIPFFREWCLMHGHGAVDKNTCLGLLRRGRSIAIAPGGARESLDCQKGTMRLFLKTRKGFAKLALNTGASLVPVLAFGENELYGTVKLKSGSWGRMLQERLQRCLGFAFPIFCGRKWLPLIPKRLHVDTIVGSPLRPPQMPEGKISDEAIDSFHQKYCEALESLFEEYKVQYGAGNVKFEIV